MTDARAEAAKLKEELKSMVQVFAAIVRLATALGLAGKGSYLAFPSPTDPTGQTHIPFKRSDLKSAVADFGKALVSLGARARAGKKKERKAVVPESFSGTYIPVYAGESLRAYLNPADPSTFGSSNVNVMGAANLIDLIPQAKAGLLLRNTVTMLFYAHAHAKNLQDAGNAQYIRPDAHFLNSFNGTTPAMFAFGLTAEGKDAKVFMEDYVAAGGQSLNTFQVIAPRYPAGKVGKKGQDASFNPNLLHTYFFQNIGALNYATAAVLDSRAGYDQVTSALRDAGTKNSMLAEHNLVKAAADAWAAKLKPMQDEKLKARKKAQEAQRKLTKARK